MPPMLFYYTDQGIAYPVVEILVNFLKRSFTTAWEILLISRLFSQLFDAPVIDIQLFGTPKDLDNKRITASFALPRCGS